MKITKSQLKRLIKEELGKVLREDECADLESAALKEGEEIVKESEPEPEPPPEEPEEEDREGYYRRYGYLPEEA